MSPDDKLILVAIIIVVAFFLGGLAGTYHPVFSIPPCKIWDNNRTYDKILIADDVICKPAAEFNATYYRMEIARYNGTDYIYKQERIGNDSVKGMVICK